MSNNPIDPMKNDLERVGRNAVNRTELGKGAMDLKREARQAKGMLSRIMGIFGKK